MKNLLRVLLIYILIGVACGLFYREFTTFKDFPGGGFTQLGLAHTYLLTLGFLALCRIVIGRTSVRMEHLTA